MKNFKVKSVDVLDWPGLKQIFEELSIYLKNGETKRIVLCQA